MPGRNIVKKYDVNSYYHIYNRGVEKRKIFIDDQDYAVFLSLIKKYLCDEPDIGSQSRRCEWLEGDVEVVAFCLMPNHYHILLYQIEIDAITKLLRAICSSYVTYFNKKYDRVGSLFQDVFKAIKVVDDGHLIHLTRYIHRNPLNYMGWEWSSLGYWLKHKSANWINPQRVSDFTPSKYLDYIKDEADYRLSIDNISDVTFRE